VEIIVMDGGSADGTMEVVRRYSEWISIIRSEADNGQSHAINKGFSIASRPILHWLNGDDILLPNSLDSVRAFFSDAPDAQVAVGNAYMTEADLTPISHFRFSSERLRFDRLIDYARNHLVQPSVFFTRSAWEAVGPVNELLHYAMDADLFLSMVRRFEFHPVGIDVAYSVYHADCKTRANRFESITELALVQARHGGIEEALGTLAMAKDAGASADAPNDTENCPGCENLRHRIEAMEKEQHEKIEMLLDLDLQATR
jgi:GT2 family glycosyltransferase